MKLRDVTGVVLALWLLGIVLTLAGCSPTAYREVGGGEVKSMTTADDPMLALNHASTVRYWRAFRKAMEVAKRHAIHDRAVIEDFDQYAEWKVMAHGGFVTSRRGGTDHSYNELWSAIGRLKGDARAEVIRRMAEMNEAAAESAGHRPAASQKFKARAEWWRSLG